MSEAMRSLLTHQHRRLVGTVMRHVESNVYPHLEPAEQKALREVVIRAAGAYHDTALDVVRSLEGDDQVSQQVVNQHVTAILARLDSRLAEPRMR